MFHAANPVPGKAPGTNGGNYPVAQKERSKDQGLGSGPCVLYAPKENTGVFARLSEVGKVHRA